MFGRARSRREARHKHAREARLNGGEGFGEGISVSPLPKKFFNSVSGIVHFGSDCLAINWKYIILTTFQYRMSCCSFVKNNLNSKEF